MECRMDGRVAIITGGSLGLGRAMAVEFARSGAKVGIVARRAEVLEEAKAEILAAAPGASVGAYPCDLHDSEGIKAMHKAAVAELGEVDILVNNAGTSRAMDFLDITDELWEEDLGLKLMGAVRLIRLVFPGMKERRWGRILNVTSISVKQPVGGLILSNSLRAAVTGFAKTISNEAAPFGVTVNCVVPGFTRTERLVDLAEANAGRSGASIEEVYEGWAGEIPMGRLGEPEELAALAAFLCSEKASYVTGQSVAVDGGWIKALF